MVKKVAFGGMTICFKDRTESMEDVFGKAPLAPSEMTKALWVFVKAKRLINK